jgi:hypothetical protein
LYDETPNHAVSDDRALLRINKLRPFNIGRRSKSRPGHHATVDLFCQQLKVLRWRWQFQFLRATFNPVAARLYA